MIHKLSGTQCVSGSEMEQYPRMAVTIELIFQSIVPVANSPGGTYANPVTAL